MNRLGCCHVQVSNRRRFGLARTFERLGEDIDSVWKGAGLSRYLCGVKNILQSGSGKGEVGVFLSHCRIMG
jgi:hypothetical protein